VAAADGMGTEEDVDAAGRFDDEAVDAEAVPVARAVEDGVAQTAAVAGSSWPATSSASISMSAGGSAAAAPVPFDIAAPSEDKTADETGAERHVQRRREVGGRKATTACKDIHRHPKHSEQTIHTRGGMLNPFGCRIRLDSGVIRLLSVDRRPLVSGAWGLRSAQSPQPAFALRHGPNANRSGGGSRTEGGHRAQCSRLSLRPSTKNCTARNRHDTKTSACQSVGRDGMCKLARRQTNDETMCAYEQPCERGP
jgi:hypothetical protein